MGADVDAKTETTKKSLLILSTQSRQKEMTEFLLDTGCANLEYADMSGSTPLIWASWLGCTEIVELLLDRGADIYTKDNFDRTSLACASFNGFVRITEMLLIRGSDINGRDLGDVPYTHHSKQVWRTKYIQELIINKQPWNIKLLDDNVGILPELKEKYKEIIELSLMGLL